jgi:hypothetical protein
MHSRGSAAHNDGNIDDSAGSNSNNLPQTRSSRKQAAPKKLPIKPPPKAKQISPKVQSPPDSMLHKHPAQEASAVEPSASKRLKLSSDEGLQVSPESDITSEALEGMREELERLRKQVEED